MDRFISKDDTEVDPFAELEAEIAAKGIIDYTYDFDEEFKWDDLGAKLIERGGFQFHAEIKNVTEMKDGRLIVSGFANTKNIDRVRDIVDPSAFQRAINKGVGKLKILRNHNMREPIGLGIDASIRSNGFFFKGGISNADIGYVQEARQQIKEGLIDSFSIGFSILKAEPIATEGAPKQDGRVADRRITDLDLWEVSVVTIPANVQSTFAMVKGMQYGSDLYDRAKKHFIDRPDIDQRGELDTVDYSKTTEYIKRITEEIDAMPTGMTYNEASARLKALLD